MSPHQAAVTDSHSIADELPEGDRKRLADQADRILRRDVRSFVRDHIGGV